MTGSLGVKAGLWQLLKGVGQSGYRAEMLVKNLLNKFKPTSSDSYQHHRAGQMCMLEAYLRSVGVW